MRTACASMLAGWHTGDGQCIFTVSSRKSFSTEAPVEAYAQATICTRLLTLNRFNLTSCSLPSPNANAFVYINTSSSILTSRGAEGQKTLGAGVIRGALACIGPHTATTISTGQFTNRCVAANSSPACGTKTLVPPHAAAPMGTRRRANGGAAQSWVAWWAITGVGGNTHTIILTRRVTQGLTLCGIICS